jgi:hypothetical protein
MGFISRLTIAKERLDRILGNPLKLAEEKRLGNELEEQQEQADRLRAVIAGLAEQKANEAPAYFNPDGLRKRLAEDFVRGESFPPEDLDVTAAVGVLLKLHFSDERKKYLGEVMRVKGEEHRKREEHIANLRRQLNDVQAALEA